MERKELSDLIVFSLVPSIIGGLIIAEGIHMFRAITWLKGFIYVQVICIFSKVVVAGVIYCTLLCIKIYRSTTGESN